MLTFVLPLIAYLLSYVVMVISLVRVDVGILFFVTIVPMIAVMTKITRFPGGSNMADGLMAAMVCGVLWSVVRGGGGAKGRTPLSGGVVVVILGSVVGLITGYWSGEVPAEVHFERVVTWKNYLILPVLYFVALYGVGSQKIAERVIFCLALSMLAMDFNFYSTFRWLRASHYSEGMRISGMFTFLGPNEMGMFFAVYTFLLIGISYYIEKPLIRLMLIAVIICNFYPIVFSYSRGTYAASLFGVITLGLLKDRRLLVVPILLFVGYSFILPKSVVERIDMTFMDEETNIVSEEVDRSAVEVGGVTVDTVGRKNLWDLAKGHFAAHPILGMGFDTFRHLEGMITHSVYMRLLAEQGVVGLGVFLGFAMIVFSQSYRLYRLSTSQLGRGIGLGFFVCTVVHLVGAVTGDEELYYNLMATYWVFIGIVGRFNIDTVERQKASVERVDWAGFGE